MPLTNEQVAMRLRALALLIELEVIEVTELRMKLRAEGPKGQTFGLEQLGAEKVLDFQVNGGTQ